ncbi:MAG: class I SAM-dependent methyltransferase [Actinomycetia bacterium]|nr:class I SAM-dependent methyltransferase [Actinomycetes bacterium]
MPEWDEYAQGWDDNPAVRAYADAAYVSLCSRADSIGFAIDGTAACDFGCGTGLLTEHLAARCSIVEAIDSSAAMLDVLGTKITREAWVNVRVLAELPEAGPRYDLVVCS